VRKSVFIGHVVSVESVADAKAAVKRIKADDRKARHVVFAFRMGDDPVQEGLSDDGEPRSTGGMPILSLLRHRDDRGILVAVTRHYGGVKLGPGNLRRAYVEAAKLALLGD
jgi:putative IMPACT (imprinted ancient) family translation regulator